mmetsp:Transcript_66724/g.115986  ORF Transcript_66724/g.115986 Transcript_66724/m.115986 type:complete len:136 (+) Transcript_66724:466-873(+)
MRADFTKKLCRAWNGNKTEFGAFARKKVKIRGISAQLKNVQVKATGDSVVGVYRRFLTTPIKLDLKIAGRLPKQNRTATGLAKGPGSAAKSAKSKTLALNLIGGVRPADGMLVMHACAKCQTNPHQSSSGIGNQG